MAFSGQCALPKKGESGVYQCVSCGTDLFKVETKFESGTGWPSFWEPVSKLNILEQADDSFGMHRVEFYAPAALRIWAMYLMTARLPLASAIALIPWRLNLKQSLNRR